MSKQSHVKAIQGYRTKPDTCSNCRHYQSKIEMIRYCQVESEKRCGLGGFAVNKTSVCNMYAKLGEANG